MFETMFERMFVSKNNIWAPIWIADRAELLRTFNIYIYIYKYSFFLVYFEISSNYSVIYIWIAVQAWNF